MASTVCLHREISCQFAAVLQEREQEDVKDKVLLNESLQVFID